METSSADFDAALDRLGAGPETLTVEEREHLERHGFVALVGAVPPATVEALLARILELRQPGSGKRMHENERGCWRIDGTLELGPEFHTAWANPRLLAAVRRLMGCRFQPVSLNYRAPLTGFGHQAFHHDATFLGRPPSRGYVQSIVALVDFTGSGGSTRVVPGSHRWDHFPHEAMADAEARHPQEVALEGPAGTIFVLDGNTWHAGGLNGSEVPRHSLHASWMARDVAAEPLVNQRQPVSRRTVEAMGPDAAAILNPVIGEW